MVTSRKPASSVSGIPYSASIFVVRGTLARLKTAMEPFIVRPLEIADAAAVATLLGQLGYPTPSEAAERRLERLLSDSAYAPFVAAEESSLLGFACVHLLHPVEHDAPVALITALVVESTARRRGVGRALVETLATWAAGRGCARMVVNSGLHRNDAHAFYAQCEFQETGKRFGRSLQLQHPARGAH